jgi:hypothetical protein
MISYKRDTFRSVASPEGLLQKSPFCVHELRERGLLQVIRTLSLASRARHLPFVSPTARRALAPPAFFGGSKSYLLAFGQKYGTPYFSVRKRHSNTPEAAPSSHSFSVSGRNSPAIVLRRYPRRDPIQFLKPFSPDPTGTPLCVAKATIPPKATLDLILESSASET